MLSERTLLQEQLRNLPDAPGVYKFLDARGRLLYVGKAESIRSRVRSYFQDRAALAPKIQLMVDRAAEVHYLLTDNPVQALVWESDLVRHEQPEFNTRLKDDKYFLYLRVNVQDPWPRPTLVRRIAADGARYFGPFTHATSVRETLRELRRLFPYCDSPPVGQEVPRKPCTAYRYYGTKRCPGPCAGAISSEEYRETVTALVRFLDGRSPEVLARLQQEMQRAAELLQFERAADLRDRIRALRKVIEMQRQVYTTPVDQDIVGVARDAGQACAHIFFIRDGRMVREESFPLTGGEADSESELLSAFITQFYQQSAGVPDEIVLSSPIADRSTVQEWLRLKRGRPVRLSVPARGKKREMAVLASQNAREALERLRARWLVDSERTAGALLEVREHLGLADLPRRIECYDVSNIQGTSAVGSMVVFENGKPATSEYRRFRIKTVEGANDPAMMRELLLRRFRRAVAARQQEESEGGGDYQRWAKLPDLVIVDGGVPQLNAALEVRHSLGLAEVSFVGLAKENEEVFMEDYATEKANPVPVVLPRDSQGLFLLQRIRDEAHRFAITYHRKVRGKRSVRSALDEVPGIGPRRKQALLRHFGSVKAIRDASLEELASAPGMTMRMARELKDHLG